MSESEPIEVFTVRIDEQATTGDIDRLVRSLAENGYYVDVSIADLEAYVMRDKIDE